MGLCTLCATIPFHSLPTPPTAERSIRIADERDMPQLWYEKDKAIAKGSALGFPWQENLDALSSSAKSCPLCGLVQKGVDTWLALYDRALATNKLFVEFHGDKLPIPVGQQLWLTQRFGGSPGFAVLVRNPKRAHAVNVLTGVSFSVGPESPWAHQLTLRPMDWDSSSASSLEVARLWLKDCIENHEMCVEGGTTLPSRVLDIDSARDTIKLVDGSRLSGRYACLSYCWGDGPHYITDRECIKARQVGFHISELTKTLQDAIVIARHMGLNYIWIDSLCICQDDSEEWARESARMTNVYSNAHLVIAANHATNSSVGCFHTRERQPVASITIPEFDESRSNEVMLEALLVAPGDEYGQSLVEFKSEPLSDRGWALQELGSLYNHKIARLESANHETWNALLWAYGNRKFTKASDKLPAFSGLARLFEQQLGAKYVAGLWSDDLVEGLAWQCIGTRQRLSDSPRVYTGPSWSWANYEGFAATGVRKRGFRDFAEIMDWHIEVKNEANPYGEVKAGWIRIRAPMTKLSPSPIDVNEHEKRLNRAGFPHPHPRMCTPYSEDENGNIVSLDHSEDEKLGEWRQWNLKALMLGGNLRKRGKGSDENTANGGGEAVVSSCYCMVVRKSNNDNGGMERLKRVGWMSLSEEEGIKVRESEENWSTVLII